MKNETIDVFKENGVLNLEKVINEYNAYIYKILRNSISNELDIEEILSDVFIVFWKNYERLDINTQVKPYLIGITRNLVKKKYRQYKLIEIKDIELYKDEIFNNIDIDELIENNEKSKIIEYTLDNLKNIDKQIFINFYFKQMKIKDISKFLNMSEGKIKIVLYRVRKKIKKDLKERGYNYGK